MEHCCRGSVRRQGNADSTLRVPHHHLSRPAVLLVWWRLLPPYMYRGVPYYYPVPVPYDAYYDSPPVGAIIIAVAGVTYLMSKDGSYSKKTTSNEGKEVYQSVPPAQGASIKTLTAT